MSTEVAMKVTNEKPMVYVLLPIHNRREITLAFIKNLQRQTCNNYHLILIDDGSTDGTAEAAEKIIPNMTIIRGKGNWWWAGGLQQGHDWFVKNHISGANIVLIMNDDTAFDADFISIGLQILQNNPSSLLTATGFNLKNGKSQDSGGYILNWRTLGFAETYKNDEINCTSTRGLMTTVQDYLDVGGFHPRLIPHYLSDLEFTMRAQKKGKKLIIHPDFRIGINFEMTGIHDLSSENFTNYVKKVFSKRAAMNPVYWSNFILLHAPWKYKLINVRRIWGAVYEQGILDRLIPELKHKFFSRYTK